MHTIIKFCINDTKWHNSTRRFIWNWIYDVLVNFKIHSVTTGVARAGSVCTSAEHVERENTLEHTYALKRCLKTWQNGPYKTNTLTTVRNMQNNKT